MSDDVLKQLQSYGIPANLLKEVEGGFMRNKDYTEKTSELSRAREQLAFLAGRAQGGGANGSPAAPKKSHLEAAFEGLPDTEETRGAKELFMGLFSAFQKDVDESTQNRMQPVLSELSASKQAAELERRLESELIPYYGAGIRDEWPQLREQMKAALGRGEFVDPIGFAARALPAEKAQALVSSRLEADQQTQSASTTEGFVPVRREQPGLQVPNGTPPGAPNGAPNGGRTHAGPPTQREQVADFLKIAAQVEAGGGRQR